MATIAVQAMTFTTSQTNRGFAKTEIFRVGNGKSVSIFVTSSVLDFNIQEFRK